MEHCCQHHNEEVFDFSKQLASVIAECNYVLNKLHVTVLKAANPFKRGEFVRYESDLISQLRKAFGKVAGDEVGKIKSLIKNVNLNKPETIEKFVKQTIEELRGLERGVAREIVPILEQSVREMYGLAKVAKVKELFNSGNLTGDKKKYDAFGGRDERVVDMIHKHQTYWVQEGVRNQIKNFDVRMRNALSEGLEKGWTSKDMGGELERLFGNTVNDPSYWNVVSSAWMNRTRNWSALEIMNEAGIERYVIIEAMDERTCPICENMNGKEFSVKKQINTLEKVANSEDSEDLRYMTPWLTTRKGDKDEVEIGYRRSPGGRFIPIGTAAALDKTESALQRLGIAMPPFHGLCRGTVGAA